MSVDQLSLFEEQEDVNQKPSIICTPRFQPNDLLTIKHPDNSMDPEDYYYVSSFAGKQGNVMSIKVLDNGKVCYEIIFPNDSVGIFYEEDLTD